MRVLRGRWRQAATSSATMNSCCMERLAAPPVEGELVRRRSREEQQACVQSMEMVRALGGGKR